MPIAYLGRTTPDSYRIKTDDFANAGAKQLLGGGQRNVSRRHGNVSIVQDSYADPCR